VARSLGRRIPTATQRQALTVALLGVGAVMTSTIALLVATPFDLDQVLFEVTSAFGTVGGVPSCTGDRRSDPSLGNDKNDNAVLVVGLGRFGSALAETLIELDLEVLGIDADPEVVASWAGRLTHVVGVDPTNEDALRQLGCADFHRAVVGIGTHLEASILSASVLVDIGIDEIWAKADSAAHGRILRRVGAHHVVFPEHDVGVRVAHQGRRPDDGLHRVRRGPGDGQDAGSQGTGGQRPRRFRHSGEIRDHGHRNQKPGNDFTHATGETRVDSGDILIVSGTPADVEKLAA